MLWVTERRRVIHVVRDAERMGVVKEARDRSSALNFTLVVSLFSKVIGGKFLLLFFRHLITSEYCKEHFKKAYLMMKTSFNILTTHLLSVIGLNFIIFISMSLCLDSLILLETRC